MQPKTKDKNIGLFVLISQPPNASEIIAVLRVIDDYDGLILCFRTPITVMSVKHVSELWRYALKGYEDKIVLTSCNTNFATVAELPDSFNGKTVLTLSRKVFVHLSNMGIECQLVDRLRGYHDIFLRSAYIQGQALDFINEKYGTKR